MHIADMNVFVPDANPGMGFALARTAQVPDAKKAYGALQHPNCLRPFGGYAGCEEVQANGIRFHPTRGLSAVHIIFLKPTT